MKRERTTKGRKTKVWLVGLFGALLIGMSGACGVETESEPVDRSVPITEAVEGTLENTQDGEELELIAEGLPTTEDEIGVTKEIVSEATTPPEATAELTPEPTATPTPVPTAVPTPEPTSTPAPTPAPTATPAPTPAPTEEPVVEKTTPTGTDYILNTNTYKFHYPSCSSVKQMKDKNKAYYTGTREECISMGYDPCGRCKP